MNKKFCTHCGKEVDTSAVVCINCGCNLGTQNNKSNFNINDFLMKITPIFSYILIGLGTLMLLVNIIYWLCYVAEYAFSEFKTILGYGIFGYLLTPCIAIGVGLILLKLSKKE